MLALDRQRTVDQPSRRSPELETCREELEMCREELEMYRDELEMCRDELALCRENLTACREDHASTTKASWNGVEVSVRPAETSHRRESAKPGAWSTRVDSVVSTACPRAPSTVPFAERTIPRPWTSCSNAERIALQPSPTWPLCEATCPAGELTLPRVMHDLPRCRTQRAVASNALDRRDILAYSPARRLGSDAETSAHVAERACPPAEPSVRRNAVELTRTSRQALGSGNSPVGVLEATATRAERIEPAGRSHLPRRRAHHTTNVNDRTRCVTHHTQGIDSPSSTRRSSPPTLIAVPPTGGTTRPATARISPRIITHQ